MKKTIVFSVSEDVSLPEGNSRLQVRVPSLIEKLKNLAKYNFCEDCYQKYLDLIQGEIEFLLSDPICDWNQAEEDITVMFLNHKGHFKETTLGSWSLNLSEDELQNIRKRPNFKGKLDYLRKHGILKENVYNFLDKVRERRNKIHPPFTFSQHDYVLFRQAKELTGTIRTPVMFDLKDERWKRTLVNVENYAKKLLSKLAN